MIKEIIGQPLTYGQAQGEILRLTEPISFWGGIDPQTGLIVDIHHPQHGQSVSNRILVLPSSRGSSTGSYVLLELMRARLAPIGIVLSEPDGVICTGVLVGFETYGFTLPVIQISQTDLKTIESGSAGQVVSQETVGFLTIS